MQIDRIVYRESRPGSSSPFKDHSVELGAILEQDDSLDKCLGVLKKEVRKLLYPETAEIKKEIDEQINRTKKEFDQISEDDIVEALRTNGSKQQVLNNLRDLGQKRLKALPPATVVETELVDDDD